MADFTLSRKLRLFLQIENGFMFPLLGEKLPVSVGRKRFYGQTLCIFPHDGYNFFSSREVERLTWIANSLQLELCIFSKCSSPVIEITDYSD